MRSAISVFCPVVVKEIGLSMRLVFIGLKNKFCNERFINLAMKLGMSAKYLAHSEAEDWNLANKIDAGMKALKKRKLNSKKLS